MIGSISRTGFSCDCCALRARVRIQEGEACGCKYHPTTTKRISISVFLDGSEGQLRGCRARAFVAGLPLRSLSKQKGFALNLRRLCE